jgi:DNA helicase-2/ATP-dependent DNA helicase PcrA
LHNLEAYEEERRLFYVACSRAEEELYLTMPAYYSAWDNYFTKPSRFIAEVNKNKYQVYKPDKD